MPWSGPVANGRGWVGGTHYVPKTGLGGFDWVIPGPESPNPQSHAKKHALRELSGRNRALAHELARSKTALGATLASRAAWAKASAATRQSAPETAQAAE
jgi:hypothetical protein